MKAPAASANRPVPPVIVATVLTSSTPGPTGVPVDSVVANSRSPFAAVNTHVPVATGLGNVPTSLASDVNRPRCVAFPSPLRMISRVAGGVNTPFVVPEMSPWNGSDGGCRRRCLRCCHGRRRRRGDRGTRLLTAGGGQQTHAQNDQSHRNLHEGAATDCRPRAVSGLRSRADDGRSYARDRNGVFRRRFESLLISIGAAHPARDADSTRVGEARRGC